MQGREKGEEERGHGGDAGAEAVHVIENAERGGDAGDPEDRERGVGKIASGSRPEHGKDLRVNARSQQDASGDGHGHEEFYLVMQQAAIIGGARQHDQSGSGQNGQDLREGFAAA